MADFHEHHFRNLARARDGLTNAIVSLRSAATRMTGDDWIDAVDLLHELETDIGPRLARLRTAASDRYDEHSRLPDFDEMRTGRRLFPDERDIDPDPPPAPSRPTCAPPPADFPNAVVGGELVAKHGSIDKAMMSYEPDSPEFDHIQAYRYVSSGRRPKGWIPPIVPSRRPDDGDDPPFSGPALP